MTRDKLQAAAEPPLLQQLQLQDFVLSVGCQVVTRQQRSAGSIEVIMSRVSTRFKSCSHHVDIAYNEFLRAYNQAEGVSPASSM